HDLLKNIIEQAGGTVSEVCIVELRESIFYAQITIEGLDLQVDARPSDAIALALRFDAPIYVMDSVLEEAGVIPEEVDMLDDDDLEEEDDDDDDDLLRLLRQHEEESQEERPSRSASPSRLEQLQRELDKAIREEDYERAARIRDEIRRLTSSES